MVARPVVGQHVQPALEQHDEIARLCIDHIERVAGGDAGPLDQLDEARLRQIGEQPSAAQLAGDRFHGSMVRWLARLGGPSPTCAPR